MQTVTWATLRERDRAELSLVRLRMRVAARLWNEEIGSAPLVGSTRRTRGAGTRQGGSRLRVP
jgi:hypothetical protein